MKRRSATLSDGASCLRTRGRTQPGLNKSGLQILDKSLKPTFGLPNLKPCKTLICAVSARCYSHLRCISIEKHGNVNKATLQVP